MTTNLYKSLYNELVNMSIIGHHYLKSTTGLTVDELGLGYVHINLDMFSTSGLTPVLQLSIKSHILTAAHTHC